MSGLVKNIEEPTKLQVQGRVRVSSLNLKPSADITRSPKQGKNPWNWSSGYTSEGGQGHHDRRLLAQVSTCHGDGSGWGSSWTGMNMSDEQGPVERGVRARTLYGRGPGPRPCAKEGWSDEQRGLDHLKRGWNQGPVVWDPFLMVRMTEWQTDMTENITIPQLLWRAV